LGDLLDSVELLIITGIILCAWLIAATGWVRLGAVAWLALFRFLAFRLVRRWGDR
jgi:hypothetical protein